MKQTCKSCGAEIIWTVTDKGKRMPVDAAPEHRFTLVRQGADMRAVYVPVYTSHFATCPHADEHRKEK